MCKDWEQHMALLTMEQRGQLLTAIFSYQSRGELPQGDPMVQLTFSFMRSFFEESDARYDARVQANRDNGAKGGRPRKGDNPENPLGFSETEKTLTGSETGSGSGTGSLSPRGRSTPTPARKKKSKQSVEPTVQWAENVTMTNAEHEKLLAAYGPADTARLIEILDNHKGATGKTYVSDYRAILSWCTDRLAEERARRGGARGAGLTYNPPSPAAPGEADRRAQADLERMRQYLADEKRREQEETQ